MNSSEHSKSLKSALEAFGKKNQEEDYSKSSGQVNHLSKSTGKTLDFLYRVDNDYDEVDIENSCIYEVDEAGKSFNQLTLYSDSDEQD